jgi:hypothetical protein
MWINLAGVLQHCVCKKQEKNEPDGIASRASLMLQNWGYFLLIIPA